MKLSKKMQLNLSSSLSFASFRHFFLKFCSITNTFFTVFWFLFFCHELSYIVRGPNHKDKAEDSLLSCLKFKQIKHEKTVFFQWVRPFLGLKY